MTTDLCCREKGSQEIKPPRKRTHFRQKDLAVKRRCPMDRPIQAYQIFVRAKRLKISHQELFGHGKSLPPRIATFHFWGKHPFSGPSISQETLRIENPERFVGLRFSSLGGGAVTVVVSGQVMSTFGMKVQTDTIDAWGMWTRLWRSLVRWGLCCMVSSVCIVQMGGHPLLPLKLASTYLSRHGDHSARAQNRPFLLLTCECPCVAIY